MRKIKSILLITGALLLFTFFLPWHSYQWMNETIIKLSLTDYFSRVGFLSANISSVFYYSFTMLLIVLFAFFIILNLIFKRENLFSKLLLTSFAQIGIILFLGLLSQKAFELQTDKIVGDYAYSHTINIGFYMALVFGVIQIGCIIKSRENLVTNTKINNENIIPEDVIDTSIEMIDVQENEITNNPSPTEGSIENNTPIKSNPKEVIHATVNKSYDYLKNVVDVLSIENLKHLQRLLFLINALLFFSLFLTWNSNLTKSSALIIASRSPLFHFRTKLIFVFLIHCLMTLVIFFKNKRIFVISSFVNYILMLFIVLNVNNYITFSNLAVTPMLCFIASIVGMLFILFSYIRINKHAEIKVNLFKEFLHYINFIYLSMIHLFKTIQYMFSDWKEDA